MTDFVLSAGCLIFMFWFVRAAYFHTIEITSLYHEKEDGNDNAEND